MSSLTVMPVLLCGGSGTRLWPLSRKSYPKQFALTFNNLSLFQASAKRLAGGGEGFVFDRPTIVTGSDFRFVITEQLAAIGIDPGPILIEPEGRNTAPAVLAAALHLASQDPDAVLLVAPSDHVISEDERFRATVTEALPAVSEGRLVTFGITPDQPEPGYGYLELAATAPTRGPEPLRRFIEKPDVEEAMRMLATGNYLWNAGIFLFRAADVIEAYHMYEPEMVAGVSRALGEGQTDLGFLWLAPDPWATVADISIDYAVMEKASNLSVQRYAGHWSDLGSWDAVLRESGPDGAGVATSETATAIDCRDTLLRSESAALQVVGIGLENVVVVAMSDAVLVASRDRAQDVKTAVSQLKTRGVAQAETLPRDYRPWGWYESLVTGGRFQVKRIVVHPGAALSLQSHHHRAEHWIVVEGTARVTIDNEVRLVTENQSVYVPLGSRHRMENPGKVPMVLIEVQTGSYLGEDDIVRYEDVYARGQGAKG